MIWQFTISNATMGDIVLPDEPIGWADITFKLSRDMTSHGLFFDFVESLSFQGSGYTFLKELYEAVGIDSYTGLLIEMKCQETADFTTAFEGKLLIAKMVFDCDDLCTATCPVDPAGCLMQFKNRIDQPVNLNSNLDFDNNALEEYSKLPFTLELLAKTIILRERAHSVVDSVDIPVIPEYTSPTQTVASGVGTQHVTQAVYISIPTGIIDINELGVEDNTTSIGDDPTGLPTLFTAPKTGNYHFDVFLDRIKFEVGSLTAAGVAFCSGTQIVEEIKISFQIWVNGTVAYNVDVFTDDSCVANRMFSYLGQEYITDLFIGEGATVKIGYRIDVGGTWHRDLILNRDIAFTFNDNSLTDPDDATKAYIGVIFGHVNITLNVYNAPTDAKVYMINEALSRTVEGVTDNCMKVKSDYFGRTDSQPYTSEADGCGSLEVITKGLYVRGFPPDSTVMAVSFKDLIDSLTAIHNIGYGIEEDADREGYQRIRVEDMRYFYDPSVVLVHENVATIKKTVQADFFKSTIEVGYDKWESENNMGLDEFSTKRNYRTTLKEIDNTASIVSKFIASGYAIEITRNIEYVSESTKDWRYDNEIFIICIRREGSAFAVELGQDCADVLTMTDIIDPTTIYNYRISPLRNFMRWVKSFMGAYFTDLHDANAKFIFTDGNGNFLAKGEIINGCIIESGDIKENDDINIADFANEDDAKPVFKNELIQYDYPMSLDDWNQLKDNPRGTIQFRQNSEDDYQEGYIHDLQYRPNDGFATFVLLPKFI